MKKFLSLFLSVALLFGVLTTVVSADTGLSWYKLIAGQNVQAGMVRVWINDSTGDLHVRFNTGIWGYCLQETHVHVADTLEGIPQKNGNPRPGRFASKHEDLGCALSDEHVFKGPWASGELYIAAHASVGKPDDPGWEETGWGVYCGHLDQFAFPGKNWAAYILYTVP